MYKAIIAIGIAAVACLVAGCGSTGDGTATAAVTKAQFIKQADATCSKAQAEGREARIAWEKGNGKEMSFDTTLRRIVGPALEQEAEELRSLPAPNGDEAKLARMSDNLFKAAAVFTSEGSKSQLTSSFEAFQREAEAYGLDACQI